MEIPEEQHDHAEVRKWAEATLHRLVDEIYAEFPNDTDSIFNAQAILASGFLGAALVMIPGLAERDQFIRHHIKETRKIHNLFRAQAMKRAQNG